MMRNHLSCKLVFGAVISLALVACSADTLPKRGVRRVEHAPDDRQLTSAPHILSVGGLATGYLNRDEWAHWENGEFARIPGLQKVYFNFKGGGDRHIDMIGIKPYSQFVLFEFADDSGNDSYYFSHRAVELPAGSFDDVVHLEGRGCVTSGPLPHTSSRHRPVLRGFELEFVGHDHKAKVRVTETYDSTIGKRVPAVEVCFADKNDDDKFYATVWWVMVPEDKVSSYTTTGKQSDGGGKDSAQLFSYVPKDKVPVLTGFVLNYKSNDHHIDRFKAEVDSNGQAFVQLQDKNADDDYSWQVWGALVAVD